MKSTVRSTIGAIALLAASTSATAAWSYVDLGNGNHGIAHQGNAVLAIAAPGVFAIGWYAGTLDTQVGETLTLHFDTGGTYTAQVDEFSSGLQRIVLPLDAAWHFAKATELSVYGSRGQFVAHDRLKGTLKGWNILARKAGLPTIPGREASKPAPQASHRAAPADTAKPLVDPAPIESRAADEAPPPASEARPLVEGDPPAPDDARARKFAT